MVVYLNVFVLMLCIKYIVVFVLKPVYHFVFIPYHCIIIVLHNINIIENTDIIFRRAKSLWCIPIDVNYYLQILIML
jgi:hypothetical protein